jgi:uncharacterized membrane protein YiaA
MVIVLLDTNPGPAMHTLQRPSTAFVGASRGALLIGACAFLAGLWNARMQLNEKG